jgi:3-hydroxybutyryl-CoA dehydratase
MGKSFDEIIIGDSAQFEVKVDATLHDHFATLFGDRSPIHCDADFSRQTKFKQQIGYAFMLTGFLSRLYGEYLPGGTSICIMQNARFIKPFYVGDTIRVSGRVSNKIESTHFVEIVSEMHRNGKECIFKGTGTVQVLFEALQDNRNQDL